MRVRTSGTRFHRPRRLRKSDRCTDGRSRALVDLDRQEHLDERREQTVRRRIAVDLEERERDRNAQVVAIVPSRSIEAKGSARDRRAPAPRRSMTVAVAHDETVFLEKLDRGGMRRRLLLLSARLRHHVSWSERA